jgi:NTE family protein
MAIKKVGLAFGGGAARGLAHVGVLNMLVKHNIPIDYIAGTSSGAFVGGLFAGGLDIDTMVRESCHLTWRNFVKFQLSRRGLFSSQPIEDLVTHYIGDITFKDIKIPFSPLVTDILTGEGVILNDPDLTLAKAIRASASFPGVFSPIKLNGRHYFDGGAALNLPSTVVRKMGADVVIAIDVIPKVSFKTPPKNIATLVDRGLDLLLHNVAEFTYKDADIVLKPINERVDSFNVKRGVHLIQLGEKAVLDNLETIQALIQ